VAEMGFQWIYFRGLRSFRLSRVQKIILNIVPKANARE